jgi:muconolactone D-isomerase
MNVIFQVEIDVVIPEIADQDMVRNLSKEESDKAKELQRCGKWKHLWRVVGKWSNLSIFDVESAEELHEILTSLPLYRFMAIRITPLCRHPASVDDIR